MIQATMIPIIAISGAFLVAILCSAFYFAYAAWKTSSDNALKRDMVARGYTADEIIAVIAAEQGITTHRPLPSVPPAKPIKQPV